MASFNKVTVQAAPETNYGDGGTPYIYLPIFTDAIPLQNTVFFEKNQYSGSLARVAPIVGTKTYSSKFRFYLRGKGSAGAPELSSFLKACALTESGAYTYTPDDSVWSSVGIKTNLDGIEYQFLGARASGWTATFKGGEPILFEADMQGIAVAPTAVDIATPSYTDATTPPLMQAMAMIINSVSTHVILEVKVEVNLGTTWLPNVNATYGQGVFTPGARECYIEVLTARDSSNDIEWYTALNAGTEFAITSSGTGPAEFKKLSLRADKLQIIDNTPTDQNNTLCYRSRFRCNYDAEELQIIFS